MTDNEQKNVKPKQANPPARPKQTKPSFRQMLSPVHTWTGLLFGWLLFLVFLMGSLSYFEKEVSIWSVPHIYQAVGQSDDKALAAAAEYALRQYPNAEKIIIDAGNDRQALQMSVVQSDGWANRLQLIANQDNAFSQASGHSRGGEFFYRLHFDLHYIPVMWARYLVGLAAIMMFIAIITGVIIHKKIITDFFTFRGKKGQRSWLDAHNALSVLPLPFHIMITFTGIITLASTYLPLGEKVAQLPDDLRRPYYALDWWASPPEKPVMVNPPKIMPLMADAKKHWGVDNDHAVQTLSILFANTEAMEISFEHLPSRQFAHLGIFRVYDYQGGLIRQNIDLPSGVVANQAMVGMHTGHMADYWLRFVFFILGLAGTAMIGTGLVLWTVKRRTQLKGESPYFGFRVVEGLNIGVVMGVPLAVVGFLWANRLLPYQMAERDLREIAIFFGAWAVSALLAIMLPKRWAWLVLSYAIALAYIFLPIINAMSTKRGFLTSLMAGDWVFVGMDVICVLVGVLFYHIGNRIRKHDNSPSKKKKRPPTKAVVMS